MARSDINQVVISGRLTKDPDLYGTHSGNSVCRISVAVNKSRKVNDEWVSEGHFIDVTAWGWLAEQTSDLARKGDHVLIVGALRQERWEDNHGNNRSRVAVVASDIRYLTFKKKGEQQQLEQLVQDDADGGANRLSSSDLDDLDDIPF